LGSRSHSEALPSMSVYRNVTVPLGRVSGIGLERVGAR
jgi:hypothetical protein